MVKRAIIKPEQAVGVKNVPLLFINPPRSTWLFIDRSVIGKSELITQFSYYIDIILEDRDKRILRYYLFLNLSDCCCEKSFQGDRAPLQYTLRARKYLIRTFSSSWSWRQFGIFLLLGFPIQPLSLSSLRNLERSDCLWASKRHFHDQRHKPQFSRLSSGSCSKNRAKSWKFCSCSYFNEMEHIQDMYWCSENICLIFYNESFLKGLWFTFLETFC